MTLTWKQHIVGWKAGALQPCCVFSFANLELEFQHLVWFKKREIKMVLGRPLSFWNLVPDHPLSFQTQACLVFAARKDANRKDVRQLHQSARIPLPPPTSALELYVWFVKGDDSGHKFQISSWSLYFGDLISCYPSTPWAFFVGFCLNKTHFVVTRGKSYIFVNEKTPFPLWFFQEGARAPMKNHCPRWKQQPPVKVPSKEIFRLPNRHLFGGYVKLQGHV